MPIFRWFALACGRLLLAPAGEWSALVPEGEPWLDGEESAAEVLAGWGAAVAIGVNWPVLSLWWEEGRTGFALSSGFRRAAAYEWDAAGRPVGEPDAMRVLSARPGLDPVLDLEQPERLARPDEATDGPAPAPAPQTPARLELPSGQSSPPGCAHLSADTGRNPAPPSLEEWGFPRTESGGGTSQR
ncbi:hypothetical protein OG625_12610 [Streptomyces sp. NBC_01351]|uniref:hypothetical protein n=1 Tax=Streptomyces sp. NBC_01351 TaxID=2903833 RepID=UPI002E31361D|nr:hypothetical protein [Streptomyces sp. NBC_01351]